MKPVQRSVIAAVIGNTVEWYDFALFGFLTPVLAKLFFPSSNQLISLLSSFAVFASGFLMRPLGAVLFGSIGDRFGRKKALLLSIVMMAGPTFLIGCLPTYQQMGVAAPLLLLLLRLVQGLSVGGEYSGTLSYLSEYAPENRRACIGSLAFVGAKIGLFLGSAVAALVASMPEAHLMIWGWRLPFLGGLLAAAVALHLRTRLDESPAYEQSRSEGELLTNPALTTLREQGRQLLLMVGIVLPQTVWIYLMFIYLPAQLTTQHGMALSSILGSNSLSFLVLAMGLPLAGLLSDTIGRKPLLLATPLLGALTAYPCFAYAMEASPSQLFLLQCYFALVFCLGNAASAGSLVEAFPTRLRCSGVSIAYNLAVGVFGGCTPFLATYLVKYTGNPLSPALIMTAAGCLGLMAAWRVPETYRKSLRT